MWLKSVSPLSVICSRRMKLLVALLLLLAASVVGPVCRAQSTPSATASRRGEVVVKVDQFEASRERILSALAMQGAELIDAKTRVDEKGRKSGWITLRLAADRLPDALRVVRTAGKLSAEKIAASDHTSDYEGLARRADHLKAHQIRLASILTSERRLRGSDILFVQERLFRASVDEGMLLQQRADIARDSRFCTLTIRLFEPMPTRTLDRVQLNIAGHFASARARAIGIVDQNRARAVTASAYALVFAPLWIPLCTAGLIALRLVYRFILRPLWYERSKIIRRALVVGKGLYTLLPERFRRPIASVHSALVSDPSPLSPPIPAPPRETS